MFRVLTVTLRGMSNVVPLRLLPSDRRCQDVEDSEVRDFDEFDEEDGYDIFEQGDEDDEDYDEDD